MCMNTLHKGDDDDYDNNNKGVSFEVFRVVQLRILFLWVIGSQYFEATSESNYTLPQYPIPKKWNPKQNETSTVRILLTPKTK